MADDIGWSLWRTFLAVLDTGSLSAAARRLSATQPTVGRHINQLEQALDIVLFTRSQEGLFPTGAAVALKAHAQSMASSAEAMKRLAEGISGVEGAIRVTASEIVGVEVLPSVLAEMRRVHASVSVELAVSNTQDDLLRRDADIAIRMVRPTQKRLLAKKLGEIELGLFAHKAYLEVHPQPDRVEDLLAHELIGIDRDVDRWRDFPIGGRGLEPSDLSFRSDNDLAQLAALRAGLGIGVCQKQIAAKDPQLIRVLPQIISFSLEMWLVMHEDQRTHQTCRAVFDFLAPALKKAISA